jgi:hypothetical protein
MQQQPLSEQEFSQVIIKLLQDYDGAVQETAKNLKEWQLAEAKFIGSHLSSTSRLAMAVLRVLVSRYQPKDDSAPTRDVRIHVPFANLGEPEGSPAKKQRTQ